MEFDVQGIARSYHRIGNNQSTDFRQLSGISAVAIKELYKTITKINFAWNQVRAGLNNDGTQDSIGDHARC
jgi:hypothetical protein